MRHGKSLDRSLVSALRKLEGQFHCAYAQAFSLLGSCGWLPPAPVGGEASPRAEPAYLGDRPIAEFLVLQGKAVRRGKGQEKGVQGPGFHLGVLFLPSANPGEAK